MMRFAIACLAALSVVHSPAVLGSAHVRRQEKSSDELWDLVQQQEDAIKDLKSQIQTLSSRLDTDERKVEFSVGFLHHEDNTAYEVTISKTQPVIFDNVLNNLGSGYDVNTGIFTAPVTGVYGFALHFMATTGHEVHLSVKWVAGSRSGHGCFAFAEGDATDMYDQGSCTVLLRMEQGQQVYVADTHHDDNHPAIWSEFTTFTGVLFYPE